MTSTPAKFRKSSIVAAIIVMLIFGLWVSAPPVKAASVTWDGGGSDNNWSTPQNWSGVEALVLYVGGKLANSPERFYVGLGDTGLNLGVAVNGDSTVLISGGWSRWEIPVSEFAEAGVNLAAVKRMVIGLGDPDAPVAGGTGLLLIDDIRILKPAP